ncbi:MAG: hypothetical protein R2684_16630 [Pyrinomonadaceae bacterium]
MQVRRLISSIGLVMVIVIGTLNVEAAIIMSDVAGTEAKQVCTESVEKQPKVDHGVVIVGLTQIFGIGVVEAIFGKVETTNIDCGVVIVG